MIKTIYKSIVYICHAIFIHRLVWFCYSKLYGGKYEIDDTYSQQDAEAARRMLFSAGWEYLELGNSYTKELELSPGVIAALEGPVGKSLGVLVHRPPNERDKTVILEMHASDYAKHIQPRLPGPAR